MTVPIWITPSGRLATVQEGMALLAEFELSSPSIITLELLSGETPPGTYFNQISNTQYQIIGLVNEIPAEKEYFFTLRAENDSGNSERGFSILVTQVTPVWLTDTRLATIVELDSFEHQFQLADPGGTAEFVKIAGTLPPGFTINDQGLLKGRSTEVDQDTVYSFTMQATSSEGTVIDKVFEIEVKKATENRSPLWLTSAGNIGSLNNGEVSNLSVQGFDPDGDVIIYTLTNGTLPNGLTLNTNTGQLQGTCSTAIQGSWPFTIRISDGSLTRLRNFNITTNENFAASVFWVTPVGALGTLKIGENSLLSVEATSNYPIRYSISSGTLPDGLYLHPTEGTIYNDTQYQPTGGYVFTVLAENDFVQASRQFSISITSGYENETIRAYFQVPYQYIDEYREITNFEEFNRYALFRPYDKRYGVQEFPRILVFENIKPTPKSELVSEYEKSMMPIQMVLGELKFAYARDENGFVVYEVIYREIAEFSHDPDVEFSHPQTQTLVHPGSFSTLRTRLQESPGVSGGIESLPLWMTSEQTQGNPDSVIGFVPAVPILFFKPGQGKQIYADLLKGEYSGNRTKGELLKFVSVNFQSAFNNGPYNNFCVHFHSMVETFEQQRDLALNSPVWVTPPGLIDDFQQSDVLVLALSAESTDPIVYELVTGELPPGLSLASNGVISGTVSTQLEKYWLFTVAAKTSNYKRTRSFSLGTNNI